jgi:hypothetical protein
MNRKITIDEKTVKKFFKKGTIRKIARKSGFIQRKGKLDAYQFFLALTFKSLKTTTITLSDIGDYLSISISKAGIHDRFNKYAKAFLQEVLSFFCKIANEGKANINIDVFNKFKSINIIDSSSWKIPKGLESVFSGYNGAGCKVQFMYDYKTGVINLVELTEETFNDQSFSKTLGEHTNGNDLFIFDLGYSIAYTINMIDEKDGYFISRVNFSAINLYLKQGKEYIKFKILEPLKKFDKNSKNNKKIFEFECYAGNKDRKTKIRLFVIKAPEEIANKRRRNLNKNAKKKGRTPKKESLELCAWSFYMTNIPVEKGIDIRTILAFYPIRWSIEIFFKQLKSILNIHKTEVKKNEYRLTCEVLGKCIVAMFITYCYSIARSYAWRLFGKEISFDKTVKYFKRNIANLVAILSKAVKYIIKYIKKEIIKIINTCKKERQKSRQNSLDVLIDRSIYESYKHVMISQIVLKRLIASSLA